MKRNHGRKPLKISDRVGLFSISQLYLQFSPTSLPVTHRNALQLLRDNRNYVSEYSSYVTFPGETGVVIPTNTWVHSTFIYWCHNVLRFKPWITISLHKGSTITFLEVCIFMCMCVHIYIYIHNLKLHQSLKSAINLNGVIGGSKWLLNVSHVQTNWNLQELTL